MLRHGVVPLWLFVILMLRYAMLIVGSLLLFLTVGPIRFKATIPGKVVGLVQAVAISFIIGYSLSGTDWLDPIMPIRYPVLGVCFGAIIVSQAFIGVRHVRSELRKRKVVRVAS
jgi:hypothetical protein